MCITGHGLHVQWYAVWRFSPCRGSCPDFGGIWASMSSLEADYGLRCIMLHVHSPHSETSNSEPSSSGADSDLSESEIST